MPVLSAYGPAYTGWGSLSIEERASSLKLLHWALQMSQQYVWQHLTHAPDHDKTLLLGHSAVSMHESIHQAVCSPIALL